MNKQRDLAECLEGIIRIFHKWMKVINKQYFADHNSIDLTPNQYRALFALNRRDAYRMSDFGEYIHTSYGSVTVMVDRLVEKGLAERFFLPEDRRVVMIRITPEGKKALDVYRETLLNIMEKNLSTMDEDTQKELYRLTGQMKKILDEFLKV